MHTRCRRVEFSTQRARWTAALSVALAVHTVAAVRACRKSALPLHTRERGTPTPSTIHMELVETLHDGAAVHDDMPFAPATWLRADDAMTDPERPRLGLWVLHAPAASARRSLAATQHDVVDATSDDVDDVDDVDAGERQR